MATLWIRVEDTFDPTSPFAESAVYYASLILYKLSGEKYPGISTVTEVYTTQTSDLSQHSSGLIQGEIHYLPKLTNGSRNLRLKNTPVRSVASVTYMGRVLEPSEYSLRNGSYLVRANGLPWVLNATEELSVTYTFGTAPPAAGKRAAIRLANELILSDKGSPNCALPERITSVSRQGINYTVMDPQEFISNGKVGIYEVDLFLAAVNPSKAKKRAKIFVPSSVRAERVN